MVGVIEKPTKSARQRAEDVLKHKLAEGAKMDALAERLKTLQAVFSALNAENAHIEGECASLSRENDALEALLKSQEAGDDSV